MFDLYLIQFITIPRGANLSESEAEQDGEHNITELPQVYSGRGNMASQQSAIRLTEVCPRAPEKHFLALMPMLLSNPRAFVCAQIGPRMTLQLIKIQDGISSGNIMYHATSKCRRPSRPVC